MTIVFKDVPAEVCVSCSEVYVGDTTSAILLKAAEDAAHAGVQVDMRECTGASA